MGMVFINNRSTKKGANKKPGWKQAEAEYEQWLMKHGAHPSQRKKEKPEPYVPPKATYVRETPHYPSLSTGAGQTSKAKTQSYTGDYFVGIATMHKSNLVPVGREQDARDYATMRRN
jgi:hypothetical protein